MHDTRSIAHPTRPLPDASLADAFMSAVEEFKQIVAGGTLYVVEGEAFAEGARTVHAELARLQHCSDEERQEAERRVVEILDRITTVALETSPRFREIHRSAFELAVRASQLAFVLRDISTPITWH